MTPRKLDPVKSLVAAAVQRSLMPTGQEPALASSGTVWPEVVQAVEVTAFSPTQTDVWVKTRQTIRHFTVQVSERW